MMSDRERWLVYPLLIFSLAIGLKGRYDAWQGNSEFHAITCRSLLVENELKEPRAILRENAQGAAELSLAGAGGFVEVSLTAEEGGGRLVLVRRIDRKALVVGHDLLHESSGIWAVDRNRADGEMAPLAIDTGEGPVWELLSWPLEKAPSASAEAQSTETPAEKPPTPE